MSFAKTASLPLSRATLSLREPRGSLAPDARAAADAEPLLQFPVLGSVLLRRPDEHADHDGGADQRHHRQHDSQRNRHGSSVPERRYQNPYQEFPGASRFGCFTVSMQSRGDELDDRRLAGWTEWYGFARREFEYAHAEAVVYANVRTVEDLNRARRAVREAA